MMLKQSNSLFVSIFHSFIFSLDAAKRNSALSSQNVKLVIEVESMGVTLMFVNCSKSQYLTVLSVDPFARAKF